MRPHAAVKSNRGLSPDDNTQPDKSVRKHCACVNHALTSFMQGPPALINRRLIQQYSLSARGNVSPSTMIPQQSSQLLAAPLAAPWMDQSTPPSSMMIPNKPSPPSPHPLAVAPWMGQFTPLMNQPSPPYLAMPRAMQPPLSMEDSLVTGYR